MSKAASQKWRQLWLKIHRWLGIGFLVLLMLIGVTGSINVYHRQFDEWLWPTFYRPVATGPALPLATLLEKAHQADPEPIVTVLLPDGGRQVLLVQHRHKGALWRTSVDQASGQILGQRDQTHSLLPTIYTLHEDLLLKNYWGGELVGIASVALLISCLTGLYLWWPRPGAFWKSLIVQAHKRTWGRWAFDLHRVIGFWSCLVLVLMAWTGFYLEFPLGVRWVVRLFSTVHTRRAPKVEAGLGPGATPDEILEIARQARPGDVPIVLDLPNDENILWRVAMRPSSWHPAVGGPTQLWIDPWRKTVVDVQSFDTYTMGESYLMLQFPLHNGAIAGEAGRFAVFLSGLALPFLSLSGGLMYYNRWGLERKAAAKRALRKAGSTG